MTWEEATSRTPAAATKVWTLRAWTGVGKTEEVEAELLIAIAAVEAEDKIELKITFTPGTEHLWAKVETMSMIGALSSLDALSSIAKLEWLEWRVI